MLSAFCFWLSASLFFIIFLRIFPFYKDLQISEKLTRYESKKKEVFHKTNPFSVLKTERVCFFPALHQDTTILRCLSFFITLKNLFFL